MTNKQYRYTFFLALLFALGVTGCKKDFGEINQNPSVVTTPDVKFLLSYTEDRLVTYQGTEWVWESMEQLLRFTQHVSASPYELSENVNTRYRTYYVDILPNLFEIRRQIDQKADAEKYQKMRAVTYVLQVLHGIKTTDMNGSIPYTEANKGRYDADFNPAYDSQQTLFDTWLKELDDAIAVLSNAQLQNQENYGNADIFYQSNWENWVKLANSLKLRIAVRYEGQNSDKTKQIFQQVMQNAIGAIDNEDAQVEYLNPNYTPFGNSTDIDYRSRRFASRSIMGFLKTSNDPRIGIFFEPNDLTGDYKDTLAKYGVNLPSFINPNDPLIMYQGAPADWTTDPAVATYVSNPFQVGNSANRYFLISPINRRFFSPKLNNATGNFLDVVVSYAETCFYIAELITKGYGAGIDTKGTAEDWYKRGIAASIRTMNEIAKEAGSTTAFSGSGDAEIEAYLSDPMVKLNGSNDLERIYIQEYLNFFRQPNEAFVFARRTGYPKLNSSYYAREPFNEVIPRRFWIKDPGEVNRENWMQSQQEQGFTPLSQDVQALNSERVWYDKNSPDFGKGQ